MWNSRFWAARFWAARFFGRTNEHPYCTTDWAIDQIQLESSEGPYTGVHDWTVT